MDLSGAAARGPGSTVPSSTRASATHGHDDIAATDGLQESRYELLEHLGEGSYGSVVKARDLQTDEVVAIKIIPLNAQEEEGFAEIQREVHLLQECNHPNVVRYLGSLRAKEALWIIMEFCGAGSTSDLMHASEAPLDEQLITYICAETLKGLAYLHAIGKVHRDVKCGNILMTNSGEVKLADFGVAARLTATMSKRNTFIGTPHWMAPEVIQESRYDGKVDVWSLGISLIEMAEQFPPRWAVHPMRVIFMISRDPPPHLSDKDKWTLPMHDFIAQCLQKDPKRRPTARQLLQHKFIINAPQAPPAGLSSLMQRLEDWLAQKAQAAPDSNTSSMRSLSARLSHYSELQPSTTAATGTFVSHSQSSGTFVPNPSGTVLHSSGTDVHSSGTFVASSAGSRGVASTASGTFVSKVPEDDGSDYMEALRAVPTRKVSAETSRVSNEDNLGSDYLAALAAVDRKTGASETRGTRGSGRVEQKPAAEAQQSDVAKLKERLRGVYEGGDVIPLPFLKAAHAAPLALLNPITAPPPPHDKRGADWEVRRWPALQCFTILLCHSRQPAASSCLHCMSRLFGDMCCRL